MRRACLCAAMLIPLFTPGSMLGQRQLTLRYEPVRDVATHIAFQTVTVAATRDGRVIETADLGSVSAVALELAEGGTVLHLAYDSVRARIRADGGKWREFLVPDADSAWLQVRVDDRYRLTNAIPGRNLPSVTALDDILTGLSDLTLPEQPVRVGGAWLVESRLPERVAISVPQDVGRLPSLTFDTRVTLDSTVVRTQDTLGFFSLSGFLRPTSSDDVQVLSENGLAVTSDLVGQLVWSTGWGGFVSGVNRVTMTIARRRVGGAPTIEQEEPELTVRATTRFQVQP